MEKSKATMTTMYLLLLVCAIVCNISGEVTADAGYESDVVDSDIVPRIELFLKRRISNILRANPGLLNYVPQIDPEHTENQQTIHKRLAGLENLDFMTGVFSRLPMRTNAAMSDLQQRMREVGRKRK